MNFLHILEDNREVQLQLGGLKTQMDQKLQLVKVERVVHQSEDRRLDPQLLQSACQSNQEQDTEPQVVPDDAFIKLQDTSGADPSCSAFCIPRKFFYATVIGVIGALVLALISIIVCVCWRNNHTERAKQSDSAKGLLSSSPEDVTPGPHTHFTTKQKLTTVSTVSEQETETAEVRKKLQSQLEEVKRECEEGKKKLEEAQTETAEVRKELQSQLEEVKRECEEGKKKLEEAQTETAEVRKELQSQLEEVKRECEEAKKKLEEAQTEMAEVRKELQSQLEEVKRECEEGKKKLEEAQTETAEVRDELQSQLEEVKRKREENKRKLDEGEEELKNNKEMTMEKKQKLKGKIEQCLQQKQILKAMSREKEKVLIQIDKLLQAVDTAAKSMSLHQTV